MGTYSITEDIDGFKVEFQIIKIMANSIKARALISGPLCSSATTCSTISDLNWYEFSSERDALDSLKDKATEKIASSINFHNESCVLCRNKK